MPNEARKLRWYAPLWKDPLGWARWVGNSKTHLACAVAFHLALWGVWIGSLFAFATVHTITGVGVLSKIPAVFLCLLGFFAGVFVPATYLYALYRLIRIIDEKANKA